MFVYRGVSTAVAGPSMEKNKQTVSSPRRRMKGSHLACSNKHRVIGVLTGSVFH